MKQIRIIYVWLYDHLIFIYNQNSYTGRILHEWYFEKVNMEIWNEAKKLKTNDKNIIFFQ